ncbi:MAG: flagellar brake protein, partial [Gemmatimonadota bacterium]|nr:flagellar brake protein [Gemmatimonadota bacterium]
EKELLIEVAGRWPGINPKMILDSLRGFNRFFGPLIHELKDKVKESPEAHRQIHVIFALRKRLFGEVDYHFGNITGTIQLKTGQKISMEFIRLERELNLPSVVMDVDSEVITVITPTLEGKYFPFAKGDRFRVSFYRENEGYYQFETEALQAVEKKNPLFLFLSHSLQIERIQPRDFFHADYRIPFKFRFYPWNSSIGNRYLPSDEKQGEIKKGVLVNISRGEMVFTTEEKLSQNDLLFFNLQLNPQTTIPGLLGKVVSVAAKDAVKDGGKKENRVQMRFFNPNTSEEEMIFK